MLISGEKYNVNTVLSELKVILIWVACVAEEIMFCKVNEIMKNTTLYGIKHALK